MVGLYYRIYKINTKPVSCFSTALFLGTKGARIYGNEVIILRI